MHAGTSLPNTWIHTKWSPQCTNLNIFGHRIVQNHSISKCSVRKKRTSVVKMSFGYFSKDIFGHLAARMWRYSGTSLSKDILWQLANKSCGYSGTLLPEIILFLNVASGVSIKAVLFTPLLYWTKPDVLSIGSFCCKKYVPGLFVNWQRPHTDLLKGYPPASSQCTTARQPRQPKVCSRRDNPVKNLWTPAMSW